MILKKDGFSFNAWGMTSGVYIHIIGAETLSAGRPTDLGWLPGFLLAAVSVIAGMKLGGRRGVGLMAGASFALLTLPLLLERSQIFADVTAGLFVIVWVAISLSIGQMKRRGLTNAISGLPNLNAIRRAITNGELAPGERITERGLAGMLSVSPTPVREA